MDKKYIKTIFRVLGLLMSAVSLILFATSFISLKLGDLKKDISGFQLAFDFGRIESEGHSLDPKYVYDYIADGGSNFGALISLVVTAASFVQVITDLVGMHLIVVGKYKPKKQITDFRYYMNIILGLIPLIVNLFTVKIAGYGDDPLANLGVGAIVSGVLCFLGQALFSFTNMLDKNKINNIIISNQQRKVVAEKVEQVDYENELKKLKELLGNGKITQVEYESKKQQLLDKKKKELSEL